MKVNKLNKIKSYIDVPKSNLNNNRNNYLYFKSVLENVVNDSEDKFDINKICSKDAIDAIKRLEKILHTQISEKDFDNKGNLDILDVLKKNSNQITRKDINYVNDNVLILYKECVITIDQCREAIEWLNRQKESKHIKEKYEEEVINIIGRNNHIEIDRGN